MSLRLRVVSRGFQYPADAESLRLVRGAGGLSKMTPEDRALVRMKTVGVGDFCDDMPEESQLIYLERGNIERVEIDDGVQDTVPAMLTPGEGVLSGRQGRAVAPDQALEPPSVDEE